MTTHKLTCAGLMVVAALAVGCGGAMPPASHSAGDAALQQASVRIGDIVVRANAVPTGTLAEAVAHQYGVARADKTVMLLVGVRRGHDSQEAALSARVAASATDLLGNRQALAMREVRSGEFIDYVGVARVIPPDTLRFDVKVIPEGTQPITLQFNRDYFPL